MAQRFGASLSQISQWRKVGVPVHLLRDVAEWTHREVEVTDLLLDIEAHRKQFPPRVKRRRPTTATQEA